MDKNELLSVLDMNEDEQLDWLIKYYLKIYQAWEPCEIWKEWYRKNRPLEWLAFRLRDEAMYSPNLNIALLDVHQKVEGAQNRIQDDGFWFRRAKPIHWIIAALIAKKEKVNG